jgi:hypothetical protein
MDDIADVLAVYAVSTQKMEYVCSSETSSISPSFTQRNKITELTSTEQLAYHGVGGGGTEGLLLTTFLSLVP